MKTKKRILTTLMVLFSAVFVFSTVNLCLAIREYQKADTLYAGLQEQYVTPAVPAASDTDTATSDVGITVDFSELVTANDDVVGWLYCPDTPINYPVVQAQDNQAYLHTGLDGNYLRSGTLFVDYRNRDISKDKQWIIYGHSMKNKSMFGSLLEYKKQAYYDAHPILYYLTADAEYRVELVAGCVMKSPDILYQPNPGSREMTEFLDLVLSKSTFRSSVEPTAEDTLIMLSTCSYEFDNARYFVLGRLIEIHS